MKILSMQYARYLIFSWIAFSILSACDKNKDPLPGDRVSFLELGHNFSIDKELSKQKMQLSAVSSVQEWSQAGGISSHDVSHASLSRNPKLLSSFSIGEGLPQDKTTSLPPLTVWKDIVYGMDAQGVVYAKDTKNERMLWVFETQPYDEVAQVLGGGVAVDEKHVYVTTSFAEVLCLNRSTGAVVWRKKIAAPIRSAPTLQNDRLYVVTLNNETFSLSTEKGEEFWRHEGIPESLVLLGGSKPAIHKEGIVIVPYTTGEVHAIMAANGSILWSESLFSKPRTESSSNISHIVARPVIDQDVVFLISHGGSMVAVNVHTGDRIWGLDIGGVQTPIVSGDWLFVINMGEVFCVHKKKGTIRWMVKLPRSTEPGGPEIAWSGPTLAEGELLFTGNQGKIIKLNPETGSVCGEIAYEGSATSASFVVNKKLYLLTDQGFVNIWQ